MYHATRVVLLSYARTRGLTRTWHREVPKFNFPTSQSKNRTTAVLLQQQYHQVVGNKKCTAYGSSSTSAVPQRQHRYSNLDRACVYDACLSFRTRAAYIRTAIRVHMSTEDFSEVVCSSTKLALFLYLLIIVFDALHRIFFGDRKKQDV